MKTVRDKKERTRIYQVKTAMTAQERQQWQHKQISWGGNSGLQLQMSQSWGKQKVASDGWKGSGLRLLLIMRKPFSETFKETSDIVIIHCLQPLLLIYVTVNNKTLRRSVSIRQSTIISCRKQKQAGYRTQYMLSTSHTVKLLTI